MSLNNEEIAKINDLYNQIDIKDFEITQLKHQVDLLSKLDEKLETVRLEFNSKLDKIVTSTSNTKAKTTK